jgi:hypothetical protein
LESRSRKRVGYFCALPLGPGPQGSQRRIAIDRETPFVSAAPPAARTEPAVAVGVLPAPPARSPLLPLVQPAEAAADARRAQHEIAHPLPVPRIFTRRRQLVKRVFETLPAVITLFVISFMLWGPVVLPLPFIFLVLSFHAYWMYKTQMNGAHAVKGFLLLRKHQNTDWRELYDRHVAAGKPALEWERVEHIVVIPNYTESAEKLRLCLDSLAAAEMADRLTVVLAMEEREGEAGREKARILCAEYAGRVGQIFATFHPWGLPGEVVGKSSNENWAAREAKRRLVDEQGKDIDYITITSCDADTVFDRKYFSCLTYSFATHPDRYRRFWQSPIFFYNNIWEVPAPLRMAHCLSGLNHISRLTRGFFRMVFPQSTYSLSLRMAHEVDYWDPDIIPEDWHMFLKCYYTFGGKVDVETMYTKLYMDGVRSHSYLATFNNYYQQSKRHAWGCTDIAYAVQMSLDHPEIPLTARLRRIWAVAECHLLWSTQWFLITTSKVIPFFAVGLVGSETLPDWYPVASRWIMLPCLATLLLLLFLDFRLRPPKPSWFRFYYWPVQYGVYFFMAFITFFTSCLPALDAQFRLALGKRLEYRVTEKA